MATILAAICLSQTGCATILNLKSDKAIYGGTKHRVEWIKHDLVAPYHTPREGLWLSIYCAAVDLPLSIFADLFTLPITISAGVEGKWQLNEKDSDNKSDDATDPTQQEVFQAPYFIEQPVEMGVEIFPPSPEGYESIPPPQPSPDVNE